MIYASARNCAATWVDRFHEADAMKQAQEALGLALLTYPRRGLPVPHAKAKRRGLIPIAVAPELAAKIAVLEAFKRSGIGKSELGRRIGKDEKQVRRISRSPPQHEIGDADRSASPAWATVHHRRAGGSVGGDPSLQVRFDDAGRGRGRGFSPYHHT
jgi:hypothetical protein